MNLAVSFLLSAIVAGAVSGQSQCSVCGDGLEVGSSEAMFSFPGQPVIACGVLEQAGKDELISPAECSFIAQRIGDICNCLPIGAVPSFTRAPTIAPVPPVVPPAKACSVCGIG